MPELHLFDQYRHCDGVEITFSSSDEEDLDYFNIAHGNAWTALKCSYSSDDVFYFVTTNFNRGKVEDGFYIESIIRSPEIELVRLFVRFFKAFMDSSYQKEENLEIEYIKGELEVVKGGLNYD